MKIIVSSHKKAVLLLFLVPTVISLMFQNCSPGFEVNSSREPSPSQLLTPSDSTPSSYSDIFFRMHQQTRRKETAKLQNQCEILGSASPLPLVTHYPNIGDAQVPPIEIVNPKEGQPNIDTSRFDLPVVGKYLADHYSFLPYSPNATHLQKFQYLMLPLCTGNLSRVRFIQVVNRIEKNGDLAALLDSHVDYFQVLHGIVFRNNVLTVVVPPNWKKGAAHNVPTLMNGFYEINANLMDHVGPFLFQVLGESYAQMRASGFGILWNGGGAIASRTMDSISYAELNAFLNIFVNDLGAARNKFITFGSSRGGVTALNLASHPAISAMNVALAYSSVPVYRPYDVAHLTSTTIPLLMSAADWSVGFTGAWKNQFRHPAGYINRSSFVGLDGVRSHLKVLTGSYEPDIMDADHNLLTPRKSAKLKKNGTQIFLEVGSHDFIVPSVDQFRLYQDALAQDLDVEVRINYLLGHYHDTAIRHQKISFAFRELLAKDYTPSLRLIDHHLVQAFMAHPDGSLSKMNGASAPLTVELPRFIVNDVRPAVTVTGPRNAKYVLLFQKNQQNITHRLFLDGRGIGVSNLNAKLFTQEGDYRLVGAYRLGNYDRPEAKIRFVATTKDPSQLVVTRYTQEIPADILPMVGSSVVETIHGANNSQSYFYPGVYHGSNFGFVSVGEEPIPLKDLEILVPSTPTAAVMSCAVTNPVLSSFSMRGQVIAESAHFGQPGHYFVAGFDVLRNEWYTFDGRTWLKYGGTEATLLSLPSRGLDAAGVEGLIFDRMDLSAYPGGKIYLGYGLGATKKQAYEEMMGSARHRNCATLPDHIQPAQYRCRVTNSQLARYSMTATIQPASIDTGRAGYYFVAGKANGKLYTYNGSTWKEYDESEASLNSLAAATLSTQGITRKVFENADLTDFRGGVVYVGYGIGSQLKEAWEDALNNKRYKECPL